MDIPEKWGAVQQMNMIHHNQFCKLFSFFTRSLRNFITHLTQTVAKAKSFLDIKWLLHNTFSAEFCFFKALFIGANREIASPDAGSQ